MVQDYDAAEVVKAMIDADFRVTLLASTGGFLRSGNTTLLSVVDAERLEELLEIIAAHGQQRTETLRFSAEPEHMTWYPPDTKEVEVGGATVFIMEVDRFVYV